MMSLIEGGYEESDGGRAMVPERVAVRCERALLNGARESHLTVVGKLYRQQGWRRLVKR